MLLADSQNRHILTRGAGGLVPPGPGEVCLYYYFNGKYASDGETLSPGGAAVFKGIRRSDKKPVLVKTWDKDAPEGRLEAEIWEKVFPDIYLESRNEGQRFVLVRNWIEGTDLERYIEDNGPMEESFAVAVCLSVALRLRRFYARTGMYFGDLRPGNVILGDNRVCFVDFESAGTEENEPGKRSFKARTLRFVSRGFSAPEVVLGRPCCGSDFYSVGVLLGFLLTGEVPGEGSNAFSGRIAAFIGKCTAPEVSGRFMSIDALAEELGAILRELGGKPFGTLEDEISFYIENGLETLVKEGRPELTPGAGEDRENGDAPLEDMPENSPDEEDSPQDSAILFPHYEKGYRRLMIYVPGNAGFAAELGYVFASCFGLETLVYEFCDYAEPVLSYYLTVSKSKASKVFAGSAADLLPTGTDDYSYESYASEDGPVYGMKSGNIEDDPDGLFSVQRFYCDQCSLEAPLIEAVKTEECGKLSFGAGTFEGLDKADDDLMRAFMNDAYTDYDITIICDDMFERRADSVQLMRYCDCILLPLADDIDRIEAEVSRFSRLLGENRISRGRLKLVCWEKSDAGAGDAIFSPEGSRFDFIGSIGYDRDRHYVKNAEGDIYCKRMKKQTVDEYCGIASRLTFGERRDRR